MRTNNVSTVVINVFVLGMTFLGFRSSVAMAQEKPSLAKQAQGILKATCYRCHGEDGTVEGGINYVLDLKTLVTRKKVLPGDPAKSKLLKRVVAGEMPPEDEKPRPTEKEIAILKEWIQRVRAILVQ